MAAYVINGKIRESNDDEIRLAALASLVAGGARQTANDRARGHVTVLVGPHFCRELIRVRNASIVAIVWRVAFITVKGSVAAEQPIWDHHILGLSER